MGWVVSLVAALGFATVSSAWAADRAAVDCEGTSPERKIDGCTQLLARKGLARPSRARAFNNRAIAHSDRKDYDLAIADYTDAIQLAPTDSIIRSNRGNAYRLKGDTARAMSDLDEAIRLNARNASAYNLRGILYDNSGEYDRAISDYDQAIRINPNFAIAFSNRAITYRNRKDYDRALRDATEAIRLAPKEARFAYERGVTYAAVKQYDRAIADYTEALRLSEQGLYYNNRGFALFEKGEYDRAIADFDQAIRLTPDYALAYSNRGRAYSGKDQFDPAISDFDQAIRLNPRLTIAYVQRGWARFRKGDLDRALADYDEAIRIEPRWTRSFNERGLIYYRKANYDRAIASYDEAIRLDPKDPVIFSNRGAAYSGRGEYDRALADFDEALRLGAKFARVHSHRGFAFEKKGALANALASYEAALAIDPRERDASAGRDRVRTVLARGDANVPVRPAQPSPAPSQPSIKPTVQAQVRVALVIGNGAYKKFQPLPNPPNDARDMAAALGSLGFDVTLSVDATRQEMEEKLSSFARAARKADVALVFYAGHGLQHQGVNYLAPITAQMTDETDLRTHFVRLPDVIADLQNANGVRLLMLDACRDNDAVKQLAASLPRSRAASVRGGLAGEKAEGILIAFATQPDRVAADGTGRNSPFTEALLKHLGTPGQEVRTMLTRVRSDVLRATGGTQRPEVSDSLDGEFAFR